MPLNQGGETYVWYTSKRLCHFRERLHDRLKEALCTLDSVSVEFLDKTSDGSQEWKPRQILRLGQKALDGFSFLKMEFAVKMGLVD